MTVGRSRICAGLILVLLPALVLSQPMTTHTKDSKSPSSSRPVVIIGASYARNWNPSKLFGYSVVNKGVGGEQTHEVLARFPRDVQAQNPRAVVIWGFINDIFRSSPQELPAKLVKTRDNIRAMVDRAKRSGIKPILVTEVAMPRPTKWTDRLAGWYGTLRGKQLYREYVNAHVVETNHWLRELARERKILILEFEKLLAAEDGYRKVEYASEDGTHLSPAAYEAMTKYAESLNAQL